MSWLVAERSQPAEGNGLIFHYEKIILVSVDLLRTGKNCVSSRQVVSWVGVLGVGLRSCRRGAEGSERGVCSHCLLYTWGVESHLLWM